MRQEFAADFVRKFRRHQRIGRFLFERPRVFSIVRRIGEALASVENDQRRRTKMLNGTNASYSDIGAAVLYATEIKADFPEPTESRVLYNREIDVLRKLMPAPMFNFGICYAYIDSILARQYPSVAFSGIDLSAEVQAFNQVSFSLPNLTFFTGDVFDHFRAHGYPGGIFFHSRTLVLMPRAFIEKLYRAVNDAGFRYIVGFEQNGLSEETQTPYTFDTKDRPSVYWRDRMYLHNYPALAEKAGFRVQGMNLFETDHSSPDYRVLQFVAERQVSSPS